MDIYTFNYDYIKSLFNEAMMYFGIDHMQATLILSVLLLLGYMLVLNRKIAKLEKTQFTDIDDITGFNRLIDEELGMLKQGQIELNNMFNHTEHKLSVVESPSNEGKLFNNAPYTQAVQLARRGYAREDIISLCSLTESEAELIIALHSNSKAA